MLCLGIEGTAHSAAVGIVDDAGRVLANVMDMYRPEEGGIHPREAADHHVQVLPGLITRAIEEASSAIREGGAKDGGGDEGGRPVGLTASDIDLVAFSQGPGLGPCLRTAATAARAFALAAGVPLVGVNHCVAHLEVGRFEGSTDPILLYTSGGNTQVIAYVDGRYRVMGETIDIGVGNFLDKLGRDIDLPFPAGPVMEKMALEGGELVGLPYSVKGMDVAFSGMLTAARTLKARGVPMPDICFSVQETAFAMLCEVAERAMAHTGKTELLLGGGVACNRRLQDMARVMCEERGARMFVPPPGLCVDNGAMIAWLGILMHRAGVTTEISRSQIRQRFRTDEVDVVWRMEEKVVEEGGENGRSSDRGPHPPPAPSLTAPPTQAATSSTAPAPVHDIPDGRAHLRTGAEAVITAGPWMGRAAVYKHRVPKGYRHAGLDAELRTSRTRTEARLLNAAKGLGVRTPVIYDIDAEENTLVFEDMGRCTLKDALLGGEVAVGTNSYSMGEEELSAVLAEVGRGIARLHRGDIIHGDLTTSNILLIPPAEGGAPTPCFIDLSLGDSAGAGGVEAMGVDMRCFIEAFRSTHPNRMELFERVWEGYADAGGDAGDVRARLADIEGRGRYR